MISFENITADSRPVDETAELHPEEEIKYEVIEPEEFVRVRDAMIPELAAYLTPHTAEEYRQMRAILYLSEDKKSGFGLKPDKQLISVFSLYKRRGQQLVKMAVKLGAVGVECLGEKLRQLYSQAGFQVVEEMPWDDALAPENWNYNRFGRPNYYILKREKNG